MHIYQIRKLDIPAWYEIGVDNDYLVIRVHPDAVAFIKDWYTKNDPRPADLGSSRPAFPSFLHPTRERWGFGPVIKTCEQNLADGWTTWKCHLIKQYESEIELFQMTASLRTLFMTLFLFYLNDSKTDGKKNQLMVVRGMGCSLSENGSSLDVEMCPSVNRWLSQQPKTQQHPKIYPTMLKAVCGSQGNRSGNLESSVRAWVQESKRIILTCPGNASGLAPKPGADEKEDGFSVISNNIDHPSQLIVLLMGLAAMHDAMREEGF